MSGSNGADRRGSYGAKGVAAPGNVPGARSGLRVVDGREREPLALRGPWPGRDRSRESRRSVEVGRHELDVDERAERREPARILRDEGCAGRRKRPPVQIRRDLVDGRERGPLALRWQRVRRRGPRAFSTTFGNGTGRTGPGWVDRAGRAASGSTGPEGSRRRRTSPEPDTVPSHGVTRPGISGCSAATVTPRPDSVISTTCGSGTGRAGHG